MFHACIHSFIHSFDQAGSGNTLPDDKCIPILRKMSKMQQESIDMYREGGRQDLVDKETGVKQLIDNFLPQVMDMESDVLRRGYKQEEWNAFIGPYVTIVSLMRHPLGVPASPR